MYQIIFLLSIAQLLPATFFTGSQQQDVRLGGKVYINYMIPVAKGTTAIKSSKKYISDFKVLLIPKSSINNNSTINTNKKRFCANDATLFKQYQVKVAYTNSDGYFEFRGLKQLTNYILIFCDHDILVSESSTGNKNATFSIGDKQIKL